MVIVLNKWSEGSDKGEEKDGKKARILIFRRINFGNHVYIYELCT